MIQKKKKKKKKNLFVQCKEHISKNTTSKNTNVNQSCIGTGAPGWP